MRKKINFFLLLSIFLLGLFLRVYKLETIPSGFHQDEAANAYMGKFVLLNGKDFYGNIFPVFYIDKWGDYPPALPMYFAGAGSILFSDTAFGARIIISLLGALTILSLYFFVKNIFGEKNIALISAFFLAIFPWHIAFSRAAAEGVAAFFFYTTALAFYFSKKKKYSTPISFLSFFLSYLSYPSFRIIIPLTLILLLILERFEKKSFRKSTILFTVFFLALTIWISTTEWGSARLKQTSILKVVQNRQDFYNQFIYSDSSPLIARIFHNKLINLTEEFLRQYFSYFSLLYLFLEGGRPEWYRFPNTGLIYLSNLLLFSSFIFLLIRKQSINVSKKRFLFLVALLFLAPLPAAMTEEHSIHMHRSIAMLLPLATFSGIAITIIKKLPFKKLIILGVSSFLILEFIKFSHNYFVHVSAYSSLHRSEGNKYAAIYLVKNRGKYDQVHFFITGWFPVYYLYFSGNYSPNLIGKLKNLYTPQLDNIKFIPKNCPQQEDIDPINSGDLVLFSAICAPNLYRNLKMIDSIKNISGTDIFWIFEKQPSS